MIKRLIGGYVPPVKDNSGKIKPGSIAAVEKIMLGGVEQWITMRGHDVANPLLLFIHGGPGCPQTGAQRKFNARLEERYTVVNWDQRGAGKSFHPGVAGESVNVQQLLSDMYELVFYLLKRFGQQKLFLMGHSVGTLFSMLFIQKHPELVRAYIGVNQTVDRIEEEALSYDWLLAEAERSGNKKAVRELARIGKPVNGLYSSTKDFVTQRTWLTKLNGVTHRMNANSVNIQYLMSTHLTLKERMRFMKGFGFTFEHLWNDLFNYNLMESVKEVNVPVYIIMGEHDRIVHRLAETYIQKLKAPYKELVIFSNSGHYACFEEAEAFNELMIGKVYKEN